MYGEMEESTKAIGYKITWKVQEFTSGLKEEFMKVNLKMIRNMVMGFIPGLMAETSKVGGTKVNNMGWEYIKTKLLMKINMDFGRWGRE